MVHLRQMPKIVEAEFYSLIWHQETRIHQSSEPGRRPFSIEQHPFLYPVHVKMGRSFKIYLTTYKFQIPLISPSELLSDIRMLVNSPPYLPVKTHFCNSVC